MTTKTDTQAAFEKWLGARADDPTLPHRILRDAFLAGVEAGRKGRVPSDGMDDVLNDALSNLEHDNYERSHQGYENRQADIELIRAALSCYGSGQPTVCQECGGDGAGGLHEDDCSQNRSQPVAWMTADGRVATDDTKRNSMSSPSREAFCIPLGIINTVEPMLDTPAASSADYEATLADHNRLVRELDVLLNGEDGAAPQASLCDIVAQVQREGLRSKWHERHHDQPAASAEPSESVVLLDALSGLVKALRERHYGRMPDEVQAAYDKAWAIVFSSPVAAPVAQEPVARANIYMHKGRRQFLLTELGTKAAGDLGVGAHDLFAAPVAAQAQRVVNQQMTTAASDVLADTQRAIIEAAEQRGYARAIAECAQDREDAERYRWLRPFGVAGLSDAQSFLQCQMVDGNTDHGRMMDAAIDAARVAKGADHG